MGDWGGGIFESDSSLDLLGGIVRKLKSELKKHAREMQSESSGLNLHRNVLPAAYLLLLLCKDIPIVAVHLNKREIGEWESVHVKWIRRDFELANGKKRADAQESLSREIFGQLSELASG